MLLTFLKPDRPAHYGQPWHARLKRPTSPDRDLDASICAEGLKSHKDATAATPSDSDFPQTPHQEILFDQQTVAARHQPDLDASNCIVWRAARLRRFGLKGVGMFELTHSALW